MDADDAGLPILSQRPKFDVFECVNDRMPSPAFYLPNASWRPGANVRNKEHYCGIHVIENTEGRFWTAEPQYNVVDVKRPGRDS